MHNKYTRDDYQQVGNEVRCGSITTAIYMEDFHENGNLHTVLHVVNGNNLVHGGFRAHIVDGKYLHVVIESFERISHVSTWWCWKKRNYIIYVYEKIKFHGPGEIVPIFVKFIIQLIYSNRNNSRLRFYHNIY